MYVAASVDAEPTIKDANVMPAVTDNTFFESRLKPPGCLKNFHWLYIKGHGLFHSQTLF